MVAGPILAISRPRYHYPVVILLLPVAAVGIRQLFSRPSRRQAIMAATAFVAFLVISVSGLPIVYRWCLVPSSHFFELPAGLPFLRASDPTFEDIFVLRAADGSNPILDRYRVECDMGDANVRYNKRRITVSVVTRQPAGPVKIDLVDRETGQRITVDPIQPSHWQQWQPTSLSGVHVMWCGVLP